MKKMTNRIKTWWRRQDASAAKEALAKEAGVSGKYLFYISIGALIFPGEFVEKVISKWLETDVTGLLTIGDGKIAMYMLALSMASLALSFVLSLKPKTQAETKKK